MLVQRRYDQHFAPSCGGDHGWYEWDEAGAVEVPGGREYALAFRIGGDRQRARCYITATGAVLNRSAHMA